jgi:hypothetical protein
MGLPGFSVVLSTVVGAVIYAPKQFLSQKGCKVIKKYSANFRDLEKQWVYGDF